MLERAVCLLIKNEENYFLTPYTDEDETKVPGKTFFSLKNPSSLTAITIWPHKDEASALDDIQKQICLKFIESKNMEYATNLRATSTTEFLMSQLNETQQKFVNAVLTAYKANGNKKWEHKGFSFSTDILEINLSNDVATPEGFEQVNKQLIDRKSFDHACVEAIKASIGFPAFKPLNGYAELNNGVIHDDQILFHPFALQLNNTVHSRGEEANKIAENAIREFKAGYEALKASSANQTPDLFGVSFDEKLISLYKTVKTKFEDTLANIQKPSILVA